MFVYILFHCAKFAGDSFTGVFASASIAKAKAADLYPTLAKGWVLHSSLLADVDDRVEKIGWYTATTEGEYLRIGRFAVLS